MKLEQKHNHPFYEIAAAVEKWSGKGYLCFQKFTCAGCGERLTMDVPNVLYKEGTCDKCPAVTNIEKDGCNFLLTTQGPITQAQLYELAKAGKEK